MEADLQPLYIALGALGGVLIAMYVGALVRGYTSDATALKGLGLPEGSIRGLIAFLVLGGFVLFIFFGKDVLSDTVVLTDSAGVPLTNAAGNVVTETDNSLFNTILAAFGTLTGAVTGFYFGNRGAAPSAGRDRQGSTRP